MSTDQPTTLAVDQLQPNPFQPRNKLQKGDVDELADSVKVYGILEPLVIAQTPAGYQIIAGERRWRAAKKVGLDQVPVIIKKTTPKGMLEMALIENVQRTDLNPLERAQAFLQLKRDYSYSNAQLASRIGKSAPYVSNTLKLLDLPDAIKDGIAGELITEGHARAIHTIGDDRSMVECYKAVLKEGASVRRTEELAKTIRSQRLKAAFPHFKDPVLPPQIPKKLLEEWQQQLRSNLHTPGKLQLNRTSRQTRITIVLKGSVEQTEADFKKIISTITHNPGVEQEE